jgi:DNA-binding CsgD family transcriptional regulator
MQKQRTEQTEQMEDRPMMHLTTLTPAEQRVLDQALRGQSTREMAQSLVLTEATIKSHLAHIYSKLGVRGRLDLLARFSLSNSKQAPSAGAQHAGEPGGRSPWLEYGMVPAVVVGALVVFVGIAWIVGGVSTPRVTLEDLQQLIEADAVADLELSGDRLAIVTVHERHFEVVGVQEDDISPVAAENEIPFTISTPSSGSLEMWQATVSILPYSAIAILVWLGIVALVRSLPRPRDPAT